MSSFPTSATIAVPASGLSCRQGTSIAEFDEIEWNGLVPRDEPQLRYDYLLAVERAGMVEGAIYFTVRQPGGDCGRLLGVAVVYRLDIDILTLASRKLTQAAAKIRKGPLKRLLILRSLSCGPVINNCRSNLYVAPDCPAQLTSDVVNALLQSMDGQGGASLRVLFEFNEEAYSRYDIALSARGYIRGTSLPNTRLNIEWPNFDDYLAAMRKFYRRAINHDLKASAGLEIEVESDFGHLAAEACQLYENVMERAEVVTARLTPAFFRELAKLEQTRLVTARENATGRLVGIELLILGDTVLQDLYTGLEYALNDRYHLYFNLMYPSIRLACADGFHAVSMGQTSYAFKSRLGVRAHPLFIYVRHTNPIVQWLLRIARNLIFPAVKVPTHRVFHTDPEPTD